MSVTHAKVTSTSPLDPKDARWIRLTRINYTDPTGRERLWESAERQTRPKASEVDGVGIVAVLMDASSSDTKANQQPKIILQKQFRPAVDKVVIEIPAGLVDEGESPQTCAIRELKEETGYAGSPMPDSAFAISPVMFNDPGFCNTNLHMVHLLVDTSRDENKIPKAQLEDGEFIECFTVPLSELYAECRRLQQEGFAIDARVGTLGEGIEFAKRFRL